MFIIATSFVHQMPFKIKRNRISQTINETSTSTKSTRHDVVHDVVMDMNENENDQEENKEEKTSQLQVPTYCVISRHNTENNGEGDDMHPKGIQLLAYIPESYQVYFDFKQEPSGDACISISTCESDWTKDTLSWLRQYFRREPDSAIEISNLKSVFCNPEQFRLPGMT